MVFLWPYTKRRRYTLWRLEAKYLFAPPPREYKKKRNHTLCFLVKTALRSYFRLGVDIFFLDNIVTLLHRFNLELDKFAFPPYEYVDTFCVSNRFLRTDKNANVLFLPNDNS